MTSREDNHENVPIPYDHNVATATIDEINKELNELKDSLSQTITKSHLLEVDLATQFNPHMVHTLKKAENSCHECKEKLELVFNKPDLLRC